MLSSLPRLCNLLTIISIMGNHLVGSEEHYYEQLAENDTASMNRNENHYKNVDVWTLRRYIKDRQAYLDKYGPEMVAQDQQHHRYIMNSYKSRIDEIRKEEGRFLTPPRERTLGGRK